jgi:hypothetical protein
VITVKWKPGAKDKLLDTPNKITYGIARMTLDLTLPTIPMKTGEMRKSSMSAGVRTIDGKYCIGSYTPYAKYTYVMDDAKRTTPGTNSRWYAKIWESKKSTIIDTIVNKEKLK